MKVKGQDGKEVLWVYDYVNDKPRHKSEMTNDEIMASEKVKWEGIKSNINAPEKLLNEAEILSIKRLRQKGLQYYEIADRIGISEERVKSICKGGH